MASFEISQLSKQSEAHKFFSPIFRFFAIFDRNFPNIVAPNGDGNKTFYSASERAIISK